MDRIQFIKNDVTCEFIFQTDEYAEANLLSRSIMSEIPTYAIDICSVDINTTIRHDEVICFRLGQCPIVQNSLVLNEKDEFKTRIEIDAKENMDFTTDDIKDITFAYKFKIARLLAGQKLYMDLIVKKGIARTHVKWRPVSTVGVIPYEGGFKLVFKNKGMMSNEEIIEKGLENMIVAANRQPSTLFTKIMLPSNYKVD